MQLDPIAVEAGVRLEALATVGSTNKEARIRAQRGERAPLWITAVSQTAGRGRMDRSWASPAGNLYASLLLREPSPYEHAPELAFVAALALRDAVIAEAPALAPALAFKWPNDLLLANQKCAGILIEGEAEPGNSLCVVIGIGINCASHPPAAAYPATDSAQPRRRYRSGPAIPAPVGHHVPAAGAVGSRPRFCGYSRRLACRRARHRRGDHGAYWQRRKARPLRRARSIRPPYFGTSRRRHRKNLGGRRVSAWLSGGQPVPSRAG